MADEQAKIELEHPNLEDLLTALGLRLHLTKQAVTILSDSLYKEATLPVEEKAVLPIMGTLTLPNNPVILEAFANMIKMLPGHVTLYNQPITQSKTN